MDAFEVIKVIGRGSYGSAVLVRARDSVDGNSSGLAGRLLVIKQISLSALEHEQEEASEARHRRHQRRALHVSVASSSAASSIASVSSHGGGGDGGGIPPLLGAVVPTRSLLNEVHILMRVGDGHPNTCRYRSSFLAHASSGRESSNSADATSTSSGKSHEMLAIVMDFYAGGDLSRRIKQRVKQVALENASSASDGGVVSVSPPTQQVLFSEEVVLDYVVQLCLGLKHIHAKFVLHRDLKTSNVFISLEKARSFHRPQAQLPASAHTSTSGEQAAVVEVLRIGDFGIARLLDSSHALARTRIGTPYFLAPEVCEGRAYSQSADQWSLGCVIYEILTGRHAFQASNLSMLVLAIMRGSYAPIPSVYSPRIHLLLSALLQKDPSRRPSATQLLALPFLRERVPHWLSPRRILEEFGVVDLALLPTFSVDLPHRISSGNAHASRSHGSGDVSPTTTSARSLTTEHASALPSPSQQYPHHPRPAGPPSALARFHGVGASSSAMASSRALPSSSHHHHQATRQPLTPQARMPSAVIVPPQSQSSTAFSAASASDGLISSSSTARVSSTSRSATSTSTPSSASASSSSVSTPSPLPVLKLQSRPLVLPPPPVAQSRSSSVVNVPKSTAVSQVVPTATTLPPPAPTPAPPSSLVGSSWTLVDKDASSRSASPPVLAVAPFVAPTTVLAPNSSTIDFSTAAPLHRVASSLPSFAWSVPSQALLALVPSSSSAGLPSLTLQCEQVRAHLERHIPLGTLREAYRILTERSCSGDSSTEGGALHLLHIGHAHLVTLLQQLVKAEHATAQAAHAPPPA